MPSPQQLEEIEIMFKRNLVFRQHQGLMADDEVYGGVCAALSYMWVTERIDGTYKLDVWRSGNPELMFMGVPSDSPIGRRFPHLNAPNIHVQRVHKGAIIKQKIFELAGGRNVEAGFRELALKERRHLGTVAHVSQDNGLGGQDIVETIERYGVKLFQGYGLIGWRGRHGGHAVAFQAAGSLNRWYDPNFGEFKFDTFAEMSELINTSWVVADYGCSEIFLFTFYPRLARN